MVWYITVHSNILHHCLSQLRQGNRKPFDKAGLCYDDGQVKNPQYFHYHWYEWHIKSMFIWIRELHQRESLVIAQNASFRPFNKTQITLLISYTTLVFKSSSSFLSKWNATGCKFTINSLDLSKLGYCLLLYMTSNSCNNEWRMETSTFMCRSVLQEKSMFRMCMISSLTHCFRILKHLEVSVMWFTGDIRS